MANQGCEEINIDELRESAQCQYGLGPVRPTDMRRPKASRDRAGESDKKSCEECPAAGVLTGFWRRCCSDPFCWDLTKSFLLFAVGVKLARQCVGCSVMKTCN